MKTQKVIFLSLTISIVSSPLTNLSALAGPHGGGAPAPHAAAPAPHFAAPAPHFSAPARHMAAPAFHPAPAAFHAPAPHFSAPAPHMAAPAIHPTPVAFHAIAPHMTAAAHFSAPASHLVAPHAQPSRQLAMTHAQAPHAQPDRPQKPDENTAHVGAARPQSHQLGGSADRGLAGAQHASNGGMPEAGRAAASMKPGEGAAKYAHMAPQQRDAFMSKMNAPERAQTMSHMNNQQRTEAMFKMSPQQRSGTLTRMNPEERKSFMSPRQAGMRAGVGVGALAAAGGAAAVMNRNNHAEAGRMQQHGGNNRENARSVGAAPSYAHPRRPQMVAQGFQKKGEPLHYGEEVKDYPRAGSARDGRAGALDPGGYIRHSTLDDRPITPAYARSQFASAAPNFNSFAAANYRNRIANRGAWPWQLPAYSPAWFGGGGNNNCYWWQDGGDGWDNGPNCFNGWGGSLPWWASIADLNPWGMNSDMSWVPYQEYYNGYTYGGETYGDQYFAPNGYCPTNYIFNVATGQFLVPGHGYVESLPQGFTAPITVSVPESVPNYNPQGQIVGYQVQTFYYNAYWNPQNEAYGYYDYRQQFHWLTFPWLNSWLGQQ